jgi:hypothetical protein
LKQKLTYFVITASAVVTGFVAKFVVDNLRVRQHFTTTRWETRLVIAMALAGLAAAGASLLSIHFSQVPGRGVTRRQDRGLLRPW